MPGNCWQETLDKLILRASRNGDLNKIKNVSSEEELIKFFINGQYRDDLLKWISGTCASSSWKKCKQKANSLRNQGNNKFQVKEYVKCLAIYNDSIKYAPMKSVELALSLANRSAVFVHLNDFEEALKDIELAFENGYPQNLCYKLFQRKGDCLIQQRKYQDAIMEFSCAQDALKDSDIPKIRKSQISNDIERALSSIKQLQMQDNCEEIKENEKPKLPVPFGGTSVDLASASRAVSLQKNKEKGRHIVACDNISVGDILFVEKPFAFVLLPQHYEERCHHCCLMLKAVVPCWECSEVLYCSELCRMNSWSEYHKWECFGGLNVVHSVGIAHLGLRVVLKAGSLMEHKSLKKKLLSDNVEEKEDYYAVYHLLTHLERMSVEDRAAYTLTAVCLLLYLMHNTDYFMQNTPNTSLNEDMPKDTDYLMIGGLILHHVCQLVCNGHAITTVQSTKISTENEAVIDEQQVRIATAIFPSASMMNHSCDPNIINSFWGTYLIVKAYRDIKKGDEVFNCYGPNFRRTMKQERIEILNAQYHFDCKCDACANDFEFLQKFTALLCSTCQFPLQERNVKDANIICCNCGSQFDHFKLCILSQEAHDLYKKGSELLNSGSTRKALHHFLLSQTTQKTCLYRSHIQRRKCLDSIAKCFTLLGDYSNGILYLQETLPAIEEQFGLWSIEMANEMQKLTDLMICDLSNEKYDKNTFLKKYAEAQKQVKRTKEIFQLHYGPWNESLREVEEKEKNLNSILDFLIA